MKGKSDEEIAAMVKMKLAAALERAKDVDTTVLLANALNKWMDTKDEGEWGQELPSESRSLNEPAGNSAGGERRATRPAG